jgi:hypothetical protein
MPVSFFLIILVTVLVLIQCTCEYSYIRIFSPFDMDGNK